MYVVQSGLGDSGEGNGFIQNSKIGQYVRYILNIFFLTYTIICVDVTNKFGWI